MSNSKRHQEKRRVRAKQRKHETQKEAFSRFRQYCRKNNIPQPDHPFGWL